MPTFGSLFAGCAGFDLGLEQAGWTCAWQVESDPRCNEVLGYHYPAVERFPDVRDATPAPVDLICGGWPCQDLSVAGNRGGLAGERSGLFWELVRIAGELKPAWILGENVPGLLSSHEGRDMGDVIGALVELGYGVVWRVLDAQYFGVAQRRRRVFLVGHLGGRPPAEVLFDAASLSRHPPTRREAGARVTGALTGGPSPSSCGNPDDDRAQAGFVVAYQQHGSSVGPMGTLRRGNGSMTGGVPFIAFNCQQDPISAETIATGSSGGADRAVLAMAENQRGELRLSETHPQLTTGGIPRRLTPTECERLQGFPDDWTRYGTAGELKDGPRYRMLGNAVAVPVARWIGERLLAALD